MLKHQLKPLKLVVKASSVIIKQSLHFSTIGKKLVRVNSKTCVYVPETATQKEIDIIISKFNQK